jgi:hypothetical protein
MENEDIELLSHNDPPKEELNKWVFAEDGKSASKREVVYRNVSGLKGIDFIPTMMGE